MQNDLGVRGLRCSIEVIDGREVCGGFVWMLLCVGFVFGGVRSVGVFLFRERRGEAC